jgi:small subunit ribosomal protein S3
MGHKVHPTGFRIGVIRDWEAKWYADRHYTEFLQEDLKLREAVQSMHPEAGVSQIEIDRQANNVSLTIYTARPGILIGRGGQRVDEMRAHLEKLIDKRVQLNIREVQQPELDAYLVARTVAEQLQRRVAYRRTMKQAMLRSMQAGARGMRISVAGRLDGAEIARRVTMHEGQVPLHTLRADIDYGFIEAHTTMGRLGIKVWIYKGDVLPEPKVAEEEEAYVEAVAPAAPAEAAAGAEPTAEVEEKPAKPRARGRPKAAPAVEPEAAKAEEPAEAVAEAAPAAEPEKKPAKPRARRAAKAAPAVEPEVAEVEEPAKAEKKPAKPRARRIRKTETTATEAVAETATGEKSAEDQEEENATA